MTFSLSLSVFFYSHPSAPPFGALELNLSHLVSSRSVSHSLLSISCVSMEEQKEQIGHFWYVVVGDSVLESLSDDDTAGFVIVLWSSHATSKLIPHAFLLTPSSSYTCVFLVKTFFIFPTWLWPPLRHA